MSLVRETREWVTHSYLHSKKKKEQLLGGKKKKWHFPKSLRIGGHKAIKFQDTVSLGTQRSKWEKMFGKTMQHCLIIYKPLMISKAGMWDLPSFFGIQIDAGAFSCQLEHSLGVFFPSHEVRCDPMLAIIHKLISGIAINSRKTNKPQMYS